MATQIGTTREYTSVDERNRGDLVNCPNCQINVVPRGITTTRKDDLADRERKHCPSCGHVFGNNSLLPRKVRSITVSSEDDETTIDNTGGGATLQLTATVTPDYADNPAVSWSSSDEDVLTVDENGLVEAVADGTATVAASAQDGAGAVGFIELTVENTSA